MSYYNALARVYEMALAYSGLLEVNGMNLDDDDQQALMAIKAELADMELVEDENGS